MVRARRFGAGLVFAAACGLFAMEAGRGEQAGAEPARTVAVGDELAWIARTLGRPVIVLGELDAARSITVPLRPSLWIDPVTDQLVPDGQPETFGRWILSFAEAAEARVVVTGDATFFWTCNPLEACGFGSDLGWEAEVLALAAALPSEVYGWTPDGVPFTRLDEDAKRSVRAAEPTLIRGEVDGVPFWQLPDDRLWLRVEVELGVQWRSGGRDLEPMLLNPTARSFDGPVALAAPRAPRGQAAEEVAPAPSTLSGWLRANHVADEADGRIAALPLQVWPGPAPDAAKAGRALASFLALESRTIGRRRRLVPTADGYDFQLRECLCRYTAGQSGSPYVADGLLQLRQAWQPFRSLPTALRSDLLAPPSRVGAMNPDEPAPAVSDEELARAATREVLFGYYVTVSIVASRVGQPHVKSSYGAAASTRQPRG